MKKRTHRSVRTGKKIDNSVELYEDWVDVEERIFPEITEKVLNISSTNPFDTRIIKMELDKLLGIALYYQDAVVTTHEKIPPKKVYKKGLRNKLAFVSHDWYYYNVTTEIRKTNKPSVTPSILTTIQRDLMEELK